MKGPSGRIRRWFPISGWTLLNFDQKWLARVFHEPGPWSVRWCSSGD